jgi:hypothetical protein
MVLNCRNSLGRADAFIDDVEDTSGSTTSCDV